MKRLLICIQMHLRDQEAAMNLARLIADLEDGFCREADVLFSHAFNTPADHASIRHVQRKFNCHVFHSDRRASGWPYGPNEQAFSTFDWYVSGVKKRGWDYKAILFLEPDCTPTRKGWIRELSDEWDRAQALCVGFMYAAGLHPIEHINGACMMSHEFKAKVPTFISCDPRIGWDCAFSKEMLFWGKASELFWVDYKCTNVTEEQLYKIRKYPKGHPLHKKKISICMHHGCKDESARNIVRRKLLSNAQSGS
jgi:hypothetical protein